MQKQTFFDRHPADCFAYVYVDDALALEEAVHAIGSGAYSIIARVHGERGNLRNRSILRPPTL